MNDSSPRVAWHEAWLQEPDGPLFVCRWTPETLRSPVPVVLLHDSLGCVALWRDFPARLCAASGRVVLAYDRLGFGRSGARTDALPLDFIAREAQTGFAALVRHCALERFIVFGHSVGGGMAVHCAARFGAACAGLITESAQAFVEERTRAGIETAKGRFQAPEQQARLRKYHGDKAGWVLDAWIGTWLSPAFAAWSLGPVLPQLRCPVLAIHGAEDEYGSVRHPELIGALSGGPARVEILHQTRHVPHREREEAVLALVSAFLNGLP